MFDFALGGPSPGTLSIRLPIWQQVLLGLGLIGVLVPAFFLTHSLLIYGVLIAVVLGVLVIRNPVWSILAFIVINVTLSIRPKQQLEGNAPSALDVDLG